MSENMNQITTPMKASEQLSCLNTVREILSEGIETLVRHRNEMDQFIDPKPAESPKERGNSDKSTANLLWLMNLAQDVRSLANQCERRFLQIETGKK